MEVKNWKNQFSFVNISFGAIDASGVKDQSLQNWKVSPGKVLAGVKTSIKNNFDSIMNTDAIVFVALARNGEVYKRTKMYKMFQSIWFKVNFDYEIEKELNGNVIVINTNNKLVVEAWEDILKELDK